MWYSLLQVWFGVGHHEVHHGVARAGVFIDVRNVGAEIYGVACTEFERRGGANRETEFANLDDKIFVCSFGVRFGAFSVAGLQTQLVKLGATLLMKGK